MSSEKTDVIREEPPHVVIFMRDGWPSAKQLWLVQLLLKISEEGRDFFAVGGPHPKPSPMGALRTSSIFADTNRQWTQVGDECYTSTFAWPLYLLQFFGFDDGDYIILTDMSWSMTVHSQANGDDDAHFSVCSVPSHDGDCILSSYRPPTDTATICAFDNGHFDPAAVDPANPADLSKRQSFKHAKTKKEGTLVDIVLSIGSSSTITFTASDPSNCLVTFGFPELPAQKKLVAELFEAL